MLVNREGKIVNLPKDINSRTHPTLFANLREVLVPAEKSHEKMFRVETHAKYKS